MLMRSRCSQSRSGSIALQRPCEKAGGISLREGVGRVMMQLSSTIITRCAQHPSNEALMEYRRDALPPNRQGPHEVGRHPRVRGPGGNDEVVQGGRKGHDGLDLTMRWGQLPQTTAVVRGWGAVAQHCSGTGDLRAARRRRGAEGRGLECGHRGVRTRQSGGNRAPGG